MTAESDFSAYVWVAPGRLGGKPCIGATRLDVDRVTRLVRGLGGGVKAVQVMYPYLTRPQILTACWYQAIYGPVSWRRMWKAWAAEHGDAMWSGQWDQVPDPTDGSAA